MLIDNTEQVKPLICKLKQGETLSNDNELKLTTYFVKLYLDDENTMTLYDRSYINEHGRKVNKDSNTIRRIKTSLGTFWDLAGATETPTRIIYDDESKDMQIPGAIDGLTLDKLLAVCYGVDRKGAPLQLSYEKAESYLFADDWACADDDRFDLAMILMTGHDERYITDTNAY